MNIQLHKLYYTSDKEIIIKIQEIDVIKSTVLGYNIRTENFVSVPASKLTEVTTNIFKYIGFNDMKLCALVANYFIMNGKTSFEIASIIGISNRTLFRYLKTLEE